MTSMDEDDGEDLIKLPVKTVFNNSRQIGVDAVNSSRCLTVDNAPKGWGIYYVNFNTSSKSKLENSSVSSLVSSENVVSCSDDGITRSVLEESELLETGSEKSHWVLFKNDDYVKQNFVLQAKSSLKGSDICVWTPADNNSKDKISPDMAQKLADFTALQYADEAGLLGKEGSSYIDKKYSDKDFDNQCINVLVFDIRGDGSSGTSGYFHAADYYYSDTISGVTTNTNRGKYIYIDSNAFSTDSNGSEISALVKTTVCHELQHLLTFRNKYMANKSTGIPAWYNEMLSLMTEDWYTLSNGVENSPYSVQKLRLSGKASSFNQGYFKSGIAYNASAGPEIADYSMAFTFGAYIMRKYGADKLLSHMAASSEVGLDSIVSSINKCNPGANATVESLAYEFISACVYKKDYAVKYNLPHFMECEGLVDIDLKNNGGLKIFESYETFSEDLNPLGFVVKKAGTVKENGTVTLRFDNQKGSASANEVIYIFFQPE